MNEPLQVTGMVVSSMPVGEYDKRLVLLTTDFGKVTAFSRGCRRPKSQMRAATEPFSFGEFVLIPRRDSYSLVGAEISNYFPELRSDMSALFYGYYFLELADYFARENINGTGLLKLLYQTLRILCKNVIDPRLIRRIYEMKVFVNEGEYPQCFSCSKCGSEKNLAYYSDFKAGLLCSDCAKTEPGKRLLDPSTIYTMQYIVTAPVQKLYTFTVSPRVLEELEEIMDYFMKSHMDRTLKSLSMLETVID